MAFTLNLSRMTLWGPCPSLAQSKPCCTHALFPEGFEDAELGASMLWVLIDTLVVGLGVFTTMFALAVHVFISK